jgi:hypothetical protein
MGGSFANALKCASIGVLVCLLTLFISASPARAQSAETGALSGTVTDPSGGTIAGATVTATNLATGQSRTVTTDTSGVYKVSLLPPGNYSVRFSASGFKTIEVPSVTVNVTETRLLDHALEVGAQSQQVTVESNVETIQAQNATVGGLVSGETVTELPLSTRNFTQVIDLSPGVVANVATATAVGNGTMDINVNGAGSDQNTYMMDGVITTNYGSGGAAQSGSYAGIPIPNPDSIQEFKVQTSQYDAAYGQNPGANVNVITKSGTNQFHGAAWEFNRNNFFNANEFFFKTSEKDEGLSNTPPEVKQNQFGGTFGGPIIKDKFFFFFSYQGTRQLNGIGSNGFATAITSVGLLPFNEPGVPFASARADGNAGTIPEDYLAGNPMCSYDTYREYLGCAFANEADSFTKHTQAVLPSGANISNTFINLLRQTENIPQVKGGFNNGYYIPSLRYDTNGTPFCMETLPLPTCSNPTTISQATVANENQYMGNTDYIINSKNTFQEKYFFSTDPQEQSFSCIVTGCDPGAPEEAQYGSTSLVARLTSVITNNFVNDAYGSFQRLFLSVHDGVTVQSCAGDGTTALGIVPAVNDGAPCPLSDVAAGNREDSLVPIIGNLGFPSTIIAPSTVDWPAWSAGGNFFSATRSIQNSFLLGDQVSWNHGKHSIRAGVNTQRIQWNWAQPNRERGWLMAGTISDLMTASSGAIDGTTDVQPAYWTINSTNRLLPNGSENPHHWRINEFSSFVQDDVKVTRKLTVNLGLRWEYDGWPSDEHGVFTNFSAAAAGLVDTGSFFFGNQVADGIGAPANQIGTLAGWIVQHDYNKAFYGPLTGQFGSTGILVNQNDTLLHGSPLDNFSPRIGLAWQPFGERFVVRAGYGLFFDRVYGNLVGDNILGNMPPYATGVGAEVGQTLQNPFCTVVAPATINSCPQFLGFIPRTLEVAAGTPTTGATSITDIFGSNATELLDSGDDPAMRTPKVQQVNLDLQYEFARGWILDVGYVGTHGIHLYDWNRDPNLAYLIAGAPNPPTDLVNQLLERPAGTFPVNDVANTNPSTQVTENTSTNYLGRVQYLGVNPGNLQQVETDGNHLYNALQMQLRHQFSHGLTLQASYTWSKLITDINASQAGGGIATPGNVLSGSASSNDPLNHAQQYGLAAFNRPQRLVISYNYELPFKADGLKGKLIGGWGVSGVTTIQDGLPFTIVDGTTTAATLLYGPSLGTGTDVRSELADPVDCNKNGVCKSGIPLGEPGSTRDRVGQYFNTAAFTNLPQFGGTPNPAWTAGDGVTGCNAGTMTAPLVPQFLACGTGFGNSGVGTLSCCTQVNFDAAIIKNTIVGGLREGANLQFRAEFFNLWNHSQFNEPGNSFGTGTFGEITSSAVPGRILQFGLKYVF